MGIKLMSLRLIPWCLHPLMGMGSYMSCAHLRAAGRPATAGKIKLIKSDGVVKIYDHPIHASELMMEFPKHMVCRSDSLYIGQKLPALSGEEQLLPGHNYILLPKHFFQSVLSFVTLASFASVSQRKLPPDSSSPSLAGDYSRNVFVRKAGSCRPFDIQKTPSGCLRIRVSEEFISQLIEEGRMGEDEKNSPSENSSVNNGRICTTQQLQKDYTMLVGSIKWKPKLESIGEGRKREFSSFTMRRNKKRQQASAGAPAAAGMKTSRASIPSVSKASSAAAAVKKTSKRTFKYHYKSSSSSLPRTKTSS